jgi:hypothetical protein
MVLLGSGRYFAGNGDRTAVRTPGDVDVLPLCRDFLDSILGWRRTLALDSKRQEDFGRTSIVPEANSLVMRGTGETVGVCGVPAELVNGLRVAFELQGVPHLGLFGVPDSDCLVGRARGKARASDIPCHRAHTILVA